MRRNYRFSHRYVLAPLLRLASRDLCRANAVRAISVKCDSTNSSVTYIRARSHIYVAGEIAPRRLLTKTDFALGAH